jgi:phospholipid/cholesterol/gamma-HCH transport system substrate-binding protein
LDTLFAKPDRAMKTRASSLMIGTLTLALIAGTFVVFLGYQKFAGRRHQVPFRVIFEGSASGLRKGGSVNFDGIRVGEVVSLKLDNPRRVVALAMIDGSAPIRKDTEVGLEFQGLTGVAAISLTGGSLEAPPAPLDADGIPVLTADPDALQDVQEKIRAALRNVDKVIADNQAAVKDTLLGLETFTATLAGSTGQIDAAVGKAETGMTAVDNGLTKTQDFLAGLGSDKYGGQLLPTVISLRELIESFDKRSGVFLAEGRRMLSDLSQSVTKADQQKFGTRAAPR